MQSLLDDEQAKQEKLSQALTDPQFNSPEIPLVPDKTFGQPATVSKETRQTVSMHNGPESLPFFGTVTEEGGKNYWQFKEICDSSERFIVYESTVRPEQLREILSVNLDEDGYISSVDFKDDLEKHVVSDFLKARFCGTNLDDCGQVSWQLGGGGVARTICKQSR